MFSQAFRMKQQPQTISSQLQMQQQRAFSNHQFGSDKLNESFSQFKHKGMDETTRTTQKMVTSQDFLQETQTSQQIGDIHKIIEQIQSIMQLKFQDMQSQLNEQSQLIRPLCETQSQIQQVLVRSEKLLSQVQNTMEKTESTLKNSRKHSNKENSSVSQETLSTISSLLEKLDNRLNGLAQEVESISDYNNKFQLQLVEMVNEDKLEQREYLHRVLMEMNITKRSVSKKMKK